ncbi:MAG: hypothetical protein RMY34_13900 [Aulosira sp. DedQUE10]|nr:hypothetical protein [Aulosira sp. DedQUE10]
MVVLRFMRSHFGGFEIYAIAFWLCWEVRSLEFYLELKDNS